MNKASEVKPKRGKLKIFFAILAITLLVLTLFTAFFLTTWVKGKIITLVEKHSEYKIKIKSVTFKGLHDIEIAGIEIYPKQSKAEFYRPGNFEKEWIEVKAKLVAKGVDWKSLMLKNKMYAEKVYITEGNLFVYRDKRMPDGPHKYRPLHSYILRNASFSLTLPYIELEYAKIKYEEKSETGVNSKIEFKKLKGNAYHLSTDHFYLEKHPEFTLIAKGTVGDSISANLKYKFNTLNKNDNFTFEGQTGPFSASLLNDYITPITSAKINSGHVSKITMNFFATNDHADGTLNIDYNNLKVDFLSKNKKNRDLRLIIRMLLNKTDRKRNGKEREEGKINCTRDKEASVFNYWWLAIRSGLISSVVKINIVKRKAD